MTIDLLNNTRIQETQAITSQNRTESIGSTNNNLPVFNYNIEAPADTINLNENRNLIRDLMSQQLSRIGLSLSKEASIDLLSQLSNKPIEELLQNKQENLEAIINDVIINNESINKIINARLRLNSPEDLLRVLRGIKNFEELGKDSNAYLENCKRQINGQGELQGVKERMEQFYDAVKRVGFNNLDSEEQMSYLTRYTRDYLIGTKTYETVENDLLTLIENTENDEDRGLYYNVLKIIEDNKDNLKNLTNEQIAELTSNAIKMNLKLYRDKNLARRHFIENDAIGIMTQAGCDADSMMEIVSMASQEISNEEVAENFNTYIINSVMPFYEENKDVLESIYNKKLEANQNGVEPEYTEEEQAILYEFNRRYVAVLSGQHIGICNNDNLPKEFKLLLISEINEANADKEFGQVAVYENIQNKIQENPDIINMSQEDFEKFMDEATNGNYSIVKNDIANGTHTELNTPKTQEEITAELGNNQNNSVVNTNNASGEVSTGSLGFNNTQEQPQVNPEKTKEAIIVASEKEVVTKPFVESKVKTPVSIEEAVATGSLKEYKAATRTTELGLTQALLNSKVAKAVELGVELFTKLSRDVQEIAFEGLRQNSAKLAVLDKLNPEQLQNIDGSNHYMQEMIDEKIEEEETKNKKQNFEVNV